MRERIIITIVHMELKVPKWGGENV